MNGVTFLATCIILASESARNVLQDSFALLSVILAEHLKGFCLATLFLAVLCQLWPFLPQLSLGLAKSEAVIASGKCDKGRHQFTSTRSLQCKANHLVRTGLAAYCVFSALPSVHGDLNVLRIIKDPAKDPSLGPYKAVPGYCVGFGAAKSTAGTLATSQPTVYSPRPIENGTNNDFKQWTTRNQAALQSNCPALYSAVSATGSSKLCCDENQFEGLVKQISALSILDECPACKVNVKNIFCQYACSPNASQFVEVHEVAEQKEYVAPGDPPSNKTYLSFWNITVAVTEQIMKDHWDFCSGVPVAYTFLCQGGRCTNGYETLNALGINMYGKNQPGSPFQMNFRAPSNYTSPADKERFCPCSGSPTENCLTPLDAEMYPCDSGPFQCGATKCKVSSADRKRCHWCDSDQSCAASGTASKNGPASSLLSAEFKDYLTETPTNFKPMNIAVIVIAVLLALLALFVVLRLLRTTRQGVSRYASHSETHTIGPVDSWIGNAFEKFVRWMSSGKNPIAVIALGSVLIIALSAGLSQVEVETEPTKLWSPPSSRSIVEMERFGELFGPFYRTAQTILTAKNEDAVLTENYLEAALVLQEKIATATFYGESSEDKRDFPNGVKLSDICWKPTRTGCAVNAIYEYFQNSPEYFRIYKKYDLATKHFQFCLNSPASQYDQASCAVLSAQRETLPADMEGCPCYSDWGAPMDRYNVYLGGYPKEALANPNLLLQSKAMVNSILILNNVKAEDNRKAIVWENGFIEMMKKEAQTNSLFNIAFMAENSVQAEIARESNSNGFTILLSYLIMFFYVTVGLGRWVSGKQFFVRQKFTVGFLGVMLVVFSVTSTFGFFSWAGVSVQLVIIEVVPFLTLAIGVDNIFLIVHAVERNARTRFKGSLERAAAASASRERGDKGSEDPLNREIALLVATSLRECGPSILLASFAEAVAFAFGTITDMPAVRWFAAFSSVAVVINLFLQLTVFVSVVILDQRREYLGKYDIFCCITSSSSSSSSSAPASLERMKDNASASSQELVPSPTALEPMGETSATQGAVGTSYNLVEEKGLGGSTPIAITPGRGIQEPQPRNGKKTPAEFADAIIRGYGKILSNPLVKLAVIIIFIVLWALSFYSAQRIELGLAQSEAMPHDSYMLDTFKAQETYLMTGPPVYYVVENNYKGNPVFDYTEESVQSGFCQNNVQKCSPQSIPNLLNILQSQPELTRTATSKLYSWVDDLVSFSDPAAPCCKVSSQTNLFLPADLTNSTYSSDRNKEPSCFTTNNPIPKDKFMTAFDVFNYALPSASCPYSGAAVFFGQFSVDGSPAKAYSKSDPPPSLSADVVQQNAAHKITAASYMTLSLPTQTQSDFISVIKQSYKICDYISNLTGTQIWSYSVIFPFFEQYLNLWNTFFLLLGMALLAILVIHAVYLFALWVPLLIVLTISMIVITIMGLMPVFDIMLNGISLVNLVVCAGISVEFCSHFARAWMEADGTADERMRTALSKVMLSVVFGITITKIIGLSVLSMASSKIFYRYYFIMYMLVVLIGFLHGLVLLPVVLSLIGDFGERLWNRKNKNGATVKREPSVPSDAHAENLTDRSDSGSDSLQD